MYFALSFVRLMMVGDGSGSGSGRFRCRSGARDVRAHRDASRTAPGRRDGPGAARSRRRRGVRKAPIFFTTLKKNSTIGNGTRGAPQLRQPLPRRRPAVHVQHEVDDCDVMTDLGLRSPAHRSTCFPRPRPMEKNNGLTQHASRNSVPASRSATLEVAVCAQRSPVARRDWSAKIAYGLQFEKSAQRNDFRDRPERPDVFKSENNSNFCPRCLSKQKVGWMRGRKGGDQVGVIGRRGEASSFSRRGG